MLRSALITQQSQHKQKSWIVQEKGKKSNDKIKYQRKNTKKSKIKRHILLTPSDQNKEKR